MVMLSQKDRPKVMLNKGGYNVGKKQGNNEDFTHSHERAVDEADTKYGCSIFS
jgi:hypothetical protein